MVKAIEEPPPPSVLAEVQAGDGISLAEGGRKFPAHRGGKKGINAATMFRWVVQGSKASDGTVVKLEAVRLGHRWLTSVAAIERFIVAMTEASTPKEVARVKVQKRTSRSATSLKAAGY